MPLLDSAFDVANLTASQLYNEWRTLLQAVADDHGRGPVNRYARTDMRKIAGTPDQLGERDALFAGEIYGSREPSPGYFTRFVELDDDARTLIWDTLRRQALINRVRVALATTTIPVINGHTNGHADGDFEQVQASAPFPSDDYIKLASNLHDSLHRLTEVFWTITIRGQPRPVRLDATQQQRVKDAVYQVQSLWTEEHLLSGQIRAEEVAKEDFINAWRLLTEESHYDQWFSEDYARRIYDGHRCYLNVLLLGRGVAAAASRFPAEILTATPATAQGTASASLSHNRFLGRRQWKIYRLNQEV